MNSVIVALAGTNGAPVTRCPSRDGVMYTSCRRLNTLLTIGWRTYTVAGRWCLSVNLTLSSRYLYVALGVVVHVLLASGLRRITLCLARYVNTLNALR